MPTTRPEINPGVPAKSEISRGGNHLTHEERARVLVEALPYIKRFHGQKIVIKVGGVAIEQRKQETLLDIVLLRYVGMLPVLVHGGGAEITALSERLGLTT